MRLSNSISTCHARMCAAALTFVENAVQVLILPICLENERKRQERILLRLYTNDKEMLGNYITHMYQVSTFIRKLRFHITRTLK